MLSLSINCRLMINRWKSHPSGKRVPADLRNWQILIRLSTSTSALTTNPHGRIFYSFAVAAIPYPSPCIQSSVDENTSYQQDWPDEEHKKSVGNKHETCQTKRRLVGSCLLSAEGIEVSRSVPSPSRPQIAPNCVISHKLFLPPATRKALGQRIDISKLDLITHISHYPHMQIQMHPQNFNLRSSANRASNNISWIGGWVSHATTK